MVHEVRRIILTPDELISAFEGYNRITPGFLPEGKIMNCVPEDIGVRVTVKRHVGDREVMTDVVVRSGDAVKPLIRFCLENNIMMPKNGQKSFYVKDGSASLYISLHIDLEVMSPLQTHATTAARSLSPTDILKADSAPV